MSSLHHVRHPLQPHLSPRQGPSLFDSSDVSHEGHPGFRSLLQHSVTSTPQRNLDAIAAAAAAVVLRVAAGETMDTTGGRLFASRILA